MKAKSIIWMLVTISLLANTFAFLSIYQAKAQITYVSVGPYTATPPNTYVYEKGQSFTVEIWVTDVLGLNSWQLKLAYDRSILYTNATMIKEGPFLKSGGSTFFPPPYDGSTYWLIACQITTSDWADGNGILVKVTFQVLQNGKSDLTLFDTVMNDVDGNPMDHTTQNGLFYTTYPSADFFWVPTTLDTPIEIPAYLKRDPVVNETITFNATGYITTLGTYRGSYDPDGFISNYTWDFGDGKTTTMTTPLVTHFYSRNGSYTMSLNVTDNQAKTNKIIKQITVAKREVAIVDVKVSPQPPKVMPGENVYINITVENRGTVYENINVTAYYNNHPIPYNHPERGEPIAFLNAKEPDPAQDNRPPLSFAPGKRLNINFTWNTAGLAEGNYALWANVSIVYDDYRAVVNRWKVLPSVEQNLTNNIWQYGNVTIIPLPNLAITELKLSPVLKEPAIVQYGTQTVSANVTVANTGAFNETGFYMTLYRDSFLIHNWTNLELQAGKNITLTTTMDLSGVAMGTYTLKANASLVPGENRTEDNQKTVSLILTLPPVAYLTYTPAKPLPNDFVKFNATSSYAAPGLSITSYEWTFEAGQIRTTTEPTYDWSYTNVQTYNVTLKVTDSNGLTGTVTKQVPVGTYPKASFTYSPSTPKVEQSITFDAGSSSPNYQQGIGGGSIQTYVWNFGDQNQTIVTTHTVAHRYLKSGNFTVTLTVIDNEGLNDTIIRYAVITKIASKLSVPTVAPSTFELGQGLVTIQGSITPAESVTISLWYKTGEGSWVLIKNVTTNGSGNFSTNWMPTAEATYKIKATWPGNEKYLGDESNETTLTVTTPPSAGTDLSGILPYVAGGIILLVVIAVGVYFIRRRKTTRQH